MQTLNTYKPIARSEFYDELCKVSKGADLHEFATNIRMILRQSVDEQFSRRDEKTQVAMAVKRGKENLPEFTNIREKALNATISYACACETSLKLSDNAYIDKTNVLKALFSTGTTVEYLRHVIGRAEREVIQYWYAQLPDPDEKLIYTMVPLSGTFAFNFEISKHRALSVTFPFSDITEFYTKIEKAPVTTAILERYYDGQINLMYKDIKKLMGKYPTPQEINIALQKLDIRHKSVQSDKYNVMKTYNVKCPDAYEKLVILDK